MRDFLMKDGCHLFTWASSIMYVQSNIYIYYSHWQYRRDGLKFSCPDMKVVFLLDGLDGLLTRRCLNAQVIKERSCCTMRRLQQRSYSDIVPVFRFVG
jgi:hypothetical protein